MKAISIDCETTGIDPDENQLIEFGAIIFDTEDLDGKRLVDLPVFERRVFHTECNWSPYARKLNGSLYDSITAFKNQFCERFEKFPTEEQFRRSYFDAKEKWCETNKCCPIEELAFQFGEFLSDNNYNQPIIALGKNFAGFDLQFIKKLPFIDSVDYEFGHRHLDPAILFLRPDDEVPPNLDECLKRAGIDKNVEHRAVADAWDTILCFDYGKRLLKFQ